MLKQLTETFIDDGENELTLDKTRGVILITFFIFIFFVLTIRLAFLCITGSSGNSPKSENRDQAFQARIPILDRNGVIIASDIKTVSLYLNKKILDSPAVVALKISEIIPDITMDNLYSKITDKTNKSSYILVKRHLTSAQYTQLKEIGLSGTDFRGDVARIYPQQNLFSHVLGYIDINRNGIIGLEKQYNDYIMNTENRALITTLDTRIQTILRTELINAIKKHQASAGVAIVAKVKDGEILGAVSLPDYDGNNLNRVLDKSAYFNKFAYGLYEMGSVFKIFTMANAIDEKIINLNDRYDVSENLKIGKFEISDMGYNKKTLTAEEIFIKSSNIGTAKIAQDIGLEKQKNFLEKLNLLEPLKLDFPYLVKPLYPKRWRKINGISISYGYGMAVTPLHMVMAMSGIVNHGIMHNLKFTPLEKDTETSIISQNTSKEMRKLLRKAVKEGTGWRADSLGYIVGGKTGTAEKLFNGDYDPNKTRASFVASFPMNNPTYTIFVMIDNPKSNSVNAVNTGGIISAPVASRIIEQIAPILQVIPSVNRDE